MIRRFLMMILFMGLWGSALSSPAMAQNLTLSEVKNGRYLIPGLIGSAPDEWVQLKDGEFKRKDPEHQLHVKIVALVLGRLSGKKTRDAAVVYGFSTGGTGFFMQLCAMANDRGQLKNSNLIDLEDRTEINSLTIRSGEIVVDMLVHGPGDPAPFPTVRRISRYALKGDKLVETGTVLPRTGRRDTSPVVSKQALYVRNLKGLAPFSPPEKFLAANFVTPEINPPFIFGTVKDFAARLKYHVDWLLEADEKNRYTYGVSPNHTGQYFVYLEEDRPDKVVYYVFADQSGIPLGQRFDWRRFFFKSVTDEPYIQAARSSAQKALQDGFPVAAEFSFIEEDGNPLNVPLVKYLRQNLKFAPLYDLVLGLKLPR